MKRILGVSSLSGTHSLKATVVHEVVEKLKLNAGEKIVFIEENGKIVIEKA